MNPFYRCQSKWFGQRLTKWNRGGRLLKSERKSIRKRAQQHNRGHEKDRGTGKEGRGGWKSHAGHLNSKAEQEQFNASASGGTFLNCLVKSVVREALTPSSITLQSGSSTPSPLKTQWFYLPSGHLLAAFTRVHKELKQEVPVGWSTPALPFGHYRRFSLPWQLDSTPITLKLDWLLQSSC